MSYENKTNEELIELLEEKDREIENQKDRIEDLKTDCKDYRIQVSDYKDLEEERESITEHAFNAGYDSCCTGSEQLRGWLNYKMEVRL